MVPARPSRGFTLVEVLLSAALVAVVAMIVYTLYRTVALLREAQGGPVSREERLQQVLAGIGRDLAAAMRVDEDKRPFALARDRASFSILAFPTLERPAAEPDPVWSRPVSVEYRVEPALGLLRVSRPLSGVGAEGPYATNLLAKAVSVFSVQALAGAEFKDEWKSGPDSAWPAACKVRLGVKEDAGAPREVILELPASLVVESTLERR